MIFVMWLSTRGCCPETVPSQQGLIAGCDTKYRY